ncbi:hypothetical protein D8674_025867 [Pyrus ussuriensis x Pyrus communis]|uniref:MRN complex-interacting protein N-terminal domain-containing protein n=1 Tax=Pyrus ussuriensis x Pyrus communis TaxID=2448454 RepID=A0A5N5I867_9ROSA|nr:hypothetical protein D8674_025867 [Pyrus ussuriensis x Pyrus communis]
MPTVFIAVQCWQCSTMQVKQRNKSNKWTCAVCNQKQSVRQVFAQGPMAKDLRLFVQSSNMSRQFAQQTNDQQQQQQQQRQEQDTLISSDCSYKTEKRRRNDWTQYLDPEDSDLGANVKPEDEAGSGFEHEIVTEFPAELWKKPKLSKYGVDELHSHKPVFSKRNFNKHVISLPQDTEQVKCELTNTKESSQVQRHFIARDDQEPRRTCQATKATLTGASKWSDYVTQDEDDDCSLRLITRRKHADNAGQCSNEIDKTTTNYGTVLANDETLHLFSVLTAEAVAERLTLTPLDNDKMITHT